MSLLTRLQPTTWTPLQGGRDVPGTGRTPSGTETAARVPNEIQDHALNRRAGRCAQLPSAAGAAWSMVAAQVARSLRASSEGVPGSALYAEIRRPLSAARSRASKVRGGAA